MRGIRTDPFTLADTSSFIQAHAVTPEGQQSKAEDSRGDVLCEGVFGQYSPVEATYKVCRGGSFDSSVKLCSVKGSYVINRIVASRINKDALSVVVGGIPKSVVGDTATLPTFTIVWPTDYLTGGNGAKAAGIVVGAGRVISSSITASVENNVVADSVGDPACMGFFAGRMESTNELQSCDTAPAQNKTTTFRARGATWGGRGLKGPGADAPPEASNPCCRSRLANATDPRAWEAVERNRRRSSRRRPCLERMGLPGFQFMAGRRTRSN
jgi:hypothetical protein